MNKLQNIFLFFISEYNESFYIHCYEKNKSCMHFFNHTITISINVGHIDFEKVAFFCYTNFIQRGYLGEFEIIIK